MQTDATITAGPRSWFELLQYAREGSGFASIMQSSDTKDLVHSPGKYAPNLQGHDGCRSDFHSNTSPGHFTGW